jgi:hypothetical protein
MLDLDLFVNLWTIFTVQLLGMASAWVARLSVGSTRQVGCQRLFFVSLVAVGVATMASLCSPPLYWVVSAVTFTLTIMVVICDFGRSERTDPFATWF